MANSKRIRITRPTQRVSGIVGIENEIPIPVSGEVTANVTFPETQAVSGTVSVSSMPPISTTGLSDEELRAKPIQVENIEICDIPDKDCLQLEWAMDKANNMPLFTEVSNPGLRDSRGAMVLSDASDPIFFSSSSATILPKIIDTAGYNTMIIHMVTAGAVTPTTSNNQLNWLGMVGYATTAPQTQVTSATASAMTVWPLTGKFVKLTGPASTVSAVIYLRNISWSNNAAVIGTVTTLTQFGGTNIVTAGVAGMLAVGGNIASGTAPTANPVQIGGVDAGRLNTAGAVAAGLTPKTRRALTDEQGRFIPPQVEPLVSLNFQNVMAALTKDTSQHEGQSIIEMLYQILVELRTLNHQIHELPISIGAGTMNPNDDLSDIRTEMKRFNYDD